MTGNRKNFQSFSFFYRRFLARQTPISILKYSILESCFALSAFRKWNLYLIVCSALFYLRIILLQACIPDHLSLRSRRADLSHKKIKYFLEMRSYPLSNATLTSLYATLPSLSNDSASSGFTHSASSTSHESLMSRFFTLALYPSISISFFS